jgi:hypothetical protein
MPKQGTEMLVVASLHLRAGGASSGGSLYLLAGACWLAVSLASFVPGVRQSIEMELSIV